MVEKVSKINYNIVDMFDVSTTKDGDLSIKIGVTGLWKAV